MGNGTKLATTKQVLEIQALLGIAVYEAKLPFGVAQRILESKTGCRKAVGAAFAALGIELALNPYAEERDWCMDFLTKAGVPTTGLDEAITPERPSDTAWLIPLPLNVGCNQIYDTLWIFPKWRWTEDLDGQLVSQDLTARWIWVEPNLPDLEPDLATLGQSANQADPDKRSIQLREGMMFYAVAYAQVGRVPDKNGMTLCGGSRFRDGNVPCLDLYSNGKAGVDRCYPHDANDARGVRQAVR